MFFFLCIFHIIQYTVGEFMNNKYIEIYNSMSFMYLFKLIEITVKCVDAF